MSVILPPSHWMFQLAQAFFMLSYIQFNMLWLRFTLCMASTCLVLWAAVFVSDGIVLDTVIWSGVFAFVNLLHAIKILYDKRTVTFSEPLSEVYETSFAHVFSSVEFHTILTKGGARLREYPPEVVLANAGASATELRYIVKGKVDVSTEAQPAQYYLDELTFVDSPQCLSRPNHEATVFTVTITTRSPTTLLVWSHTELEQCFKAFPHLQGRFGFLLGFDVAAKLYRSNASNSQLFKSLEHHFQALARPRAKSFEGQDTTGLALDSAGGSWPSSHDKKGDDTASSRLSWPSSHGVVTGVKTDHQPLLLN